MAHHPGKDGSESDVTPLSTSSPLQTQLGGAQLGEDGSFAMPDADEATWIDVIQKMDSVYAELVESQTELEEKNAALEEAQLFISSVLSSMTDVLIVCDRYGRIQQTNAALEELTGFAEHSLLGQSLGNILSSENSDLLSKMAERLSSSSPISDCEVAVVDSRGNAVPLSINCSPRFDHQGNMVGLVLIGRPLGELQKAYRKLDEAHHTLREAQQQLVFSEKMAALGRLVAGVAHELNNPISFVFGNMHALKTYGERITRYLQEVEAKSQNAELAELRQKLGIKRIMDDILPLCEGTLEGAERVSDIVQELRRFSSSQKEAPEEFALRGVIETATNWVFRGAKVSPDLVIECDEDLCLSAKKGYVHQVLVNLVQNAIDAMDGEGVAKAKGSSLHIRCESVGEEKDQIALVVRDNGHGISEEDLAHIFEPFYTTRPIGQGTGLGLYVSYNLAEEMGGSLAGRNHEEGGACFTLTLPIRPKSSSSSNEPEGGND